MGKVLSSLRLTRATVSPCELTHSFCHPQGGSLFFWGTVCMGSGPICDSYRMVSKSPFSEKSFQGYLIDIKTYLEWENIHAGYHRISLMSSQIPLRGKKKDKPDFKFTKAFVQDLENSGIANSIGLTENGFTSSFNSGGMLRIAIENLQNPDYMTHISDGRPIILEEETPGKTEIQGDHFLTWKGEKKKLVTENFRNTLDNLNKVVDPRLIKEVGEILNRKINKCFFKYVNERSKEDIESKVWK